VTIWQIDLKIRPMLHQILERLGEKTTSEIIKALAQVEAAMDNLKSEIENSQQQKSKGKKKTNIHWGDQ
jgi:predicted  nucleic acid-binding Zn-ribbon protein|tara:strand:- start:664 stop:870 length:207 start_codon:yes stop_codon:yes gene_type:complete